MTALALSRPARLPFLSELLERQRILGVYGLALLPLALIALVAQGLDPRSLDGVNVWVKPAKFLFSVAVFALTAAWFFGYVRPDRRASPLMRGTVAMLVFSGTFELAWISWQASQGLASHWNFDTPFYAIMYGLMGLFATLLTATTLPLAWEIGRRPAIGLRRDFVAAVVIGLVLTFLLGAGFGGYMSSQAGHSVGAEGGRLALFGWNRSGGDLRIAHFMGIHAQQAIPLLAAAAAGFGARTRWHLLAGGTTLFVMATLGLFAQAVIGRPLLPL
jgi:hypothetical protein